MATLTLIIFTSILAFSLYAVLRRRRRRNKQQTPLPPGPRPWPIVGNLPQLGPKPHQSMAALARVHGPLMHLKMGFAHVVVAASAGAAEQFLKVHDANFSSRPPNSGAKHVAYNYQDMVFAPYGPRWRLLRKISALHMFSGKALDDCRHIREEEVGILARALIEAGARQTRVSLGQMLSVCATNALARVTLGKRVVGHGCGGGDEKAEEFKAMVVELMVLSGVFNIGDFIPALDGLDLQGVVAKMKRLHTRFDAFLSALLEERKIDGSSQQELDSVVGQNRLVTESDLAQLTFLQAIIKETFRLHPSTPLSLPRIAQESCEVNGYFIPKGSTLLVNVWAIARDPNVWSDPLEFKPERFLAGGERPNADIRGNDFEVIPFGAGRRICAGMSLGIRMVQLLTASLIHAFDFELANGQSAETLNMEEAYGLTLQRAEPLVVNPKPRLATHVY
ncbi:flavonoid 3' 5'-hydroxylase [Phtheirospermum japonicum]|uniref:Flavonoid 3' 5'-hydroxylase n=1 Tax=Phtheirospermum japonicum TaxID=374723 RepID=A0A830BZK1_9LAMI|nr:flavonoid 3' 5'-hydroxylase [Phtheirospermum japonicum]